MFEEKLRRLKSRLDEFLKERNISADEHSENVIDMFASDEYNYGFLIGQIRAFAEAEAKRIRDTVYSIDKDTVQEYAKRKIGRELTDDELYSVKKGITAGIGDGIDIVINTAIEEATRR